MHDVLIVFALLTIFRIELNLYVVSAVLAIIGYSINDSIVSFDRIRESIKGTGQTKLSKDQLTDVANSSISHTANRSILTTITTLLAVTSLLIFGTQGAFSFNIAMAFGLIAGTYSSMFIASLV